MPTETYPRRPIPGLTAGDRKYGVPLLLRAKHITNWFDAELGEVVGVKRATVQAILADRTPEYLDRGQRERLLAAVRDYVARAQEALDEMELFA